MLIFIFILSINLSFADNNTDVLIESIDDVEFLGDSSDIYVSNEGSDSLGDGSADNPYQTLNYTIEKASNNSNIYLKSGTYTSTGYEIVNKSISITGIGDVTVDGLNGKISQNIFKVQNGSSLVLNNIKFINGYADLEGSLSPIINEGELKINNCNFYNFTTINGVILNKNSLTIDNVRESKLNIDWNSIYGEAGSGGFYSWIQNQIKNNPSRGEFVTNIGDCAILNSKFISTVYNNRNMNVTNCYIAAFISNRSYEMDIISIIDKSNITSLRVSNNKLLVLNNSYVDPQRDVLYNSNAIIQNTTFFNDRVGYHYSFKASYSNVSVKSSFFNKNLEFDYSNVNVSYSTILGFISTPGYDSYINVNYNWWGDNKGPHVYTSPYSTVISDYWIVMALDVVNNIASVDFLRYTDGNTVFNLKNPCDVNSRFVKLEIEAGGVDKSKGYLVNGTFKSKIIGDNLNTMLYATVDNQLLRFAVGTGLTDYTWYVSNNTGNDYFCDGSHDNPYKTLSRAIEKAFSGNTIYVMEGVYTLSWNADLKISKNLTLIGLGNAVLSRPDSRNIFRINDKGILTLYNFNFTTLTHHYYNPLIHLTGGELHIKNSNFYNIWAAPGIISSYSSNLIDLDNVTFKNIEGSAIAGNSSYVCLNNSKFLDCGISANSNHLVNVKANLDVLNSRFENNKAWLILVNERNNYVPSILNVYLYNTTFENNNFQGKSYCMVDIGVTRFRYLRYSVVESCHFNNNVGHLIVADVINNSTFVNNKDSSLANEAGGISDNVPSSLIQANDLINNSYFYGNELPSLSYEEHVIFSPNVYNSVFIKNKAAYGGALSEPKEVHYCVFLNNTGSYGGNDIFIYKGRLNCSSNWWGSNQKPDSSRVQVFIGDLILENWVVLNVTQDKDVIIASLNNLLDDNKTFSYLNHPLPSRDVAFFTEGGEIIPNSTKLINNFAKASLVKNTSADFDVHVQIDNQIMSLRVYNNSTKLLMDDATFYGNDNKYKITLINVNGHKISNQLLEVIITDSNGVKYPYTLVTDSLGVANLNVNYSIGMYDVEVNYYGNGYFDKSSAKAIINISSISTSLYLHNYTYWGKNNIFYTMLSDTSGRYLLNQSLILNIYDSKNKLINQADLMTGTAGRADVLLSLDVGSYRLEVIYLGNEWYEKCSAVSYVTVNPINTTLILSNVTFYGKNNDYEFTFTDVYGNKISDETITLKISNKTDSKEFKIKVESGVGSININLLPGIYNLDAKYSGDDVYGPATASASLDIQKVFLTFDFKSYAKIPKNGVFTVILKDMYGKRVADQSVSLELYEDGLYRTYNAVSNANGEANFKIDAEENIYFAIFDFNGSTWYKPTTGASTVEVSHDVLTGKVYLNGTDYVAYYGENNYYTILFNDTNKFSLEGMKIPVIISSGEFSKAFYGESDAFGNVRIQITLEPGSYEITYKYENEYYNIHDTKTNSIIIYKMPTSLVASNMIVRKGDAKNFEVKLINKNGFPISNLPVEINIDGKSYNVSTNNFGVAKLPLNLELGYHNVSCSFNNLNYLSSKCNTTILVVDDSKIITGIESNDAYGQEANLFNYSVILHDNLDNPVKSSSIILNLTDIDNNFIGLYESYTNDRGIALFNLKLTYGDYLAKTYYAGNDLYFESFNTNNIYVKPLENVRETILFGKDSEIVNGYNGSYFVVLKTVDGDFVSNASIEFVVKGNSYYALTDEVGKAVLDVPFAPGAYEVKSKYNGSNNLTKAQVTNYISVTGELLYFYSRDVIKSFNNATHYYVALFDALGQPLSGEIIKFKVGNVTYENITDYNGFACFEVWFNPGEYNITATYQGQYPDEYASVSNNITVVTTLSSENIVKYYDGTTMIVASFSNFNDDVLAKTQVIFNINGDNHKVKTNEYGMAILDIDLKPSNYNLEILNTLTGEIGKYTIKIYSTLTTKNLVKYYKSSSNFKATFKDENGNLLKNTKVKFTIKGKTYTVKTNAKGVATLKINLKPGKYTITTLNTKTSEKHTNKITIKTIIITKNKKAKANKKFSFQAKILKGNGKIAKKVTVKFKINKKTYKIKTNKKGIAKLKIKLKKGKYIIITTYKGLSVKNTVRCS